MARLSLSSDRSSFANCDILNETYDQYVVKFANGAVSMVDKDRVYALNEMDNEVLDTIRNTGREIGEKISKFGVRMINKAKDTARAIKNFFMRAFVNNGFVFFKTNDNKVLPVSHPINAMLAASSSDLNIGINVYPSEETVEFGKEMGLRSVAVQKYQFSGEYDGTPFEYLYGINESLGTRRNRRRLYENNDYNSIFDNDPFEDDYIESTPIKLTSPMTFNKRNNIEVPRLTDAGTPEIIYQICSTYEAFAKGNITNNKFGNILIWGAPGIGKSAIVQGIREFYDSKVNVISILCSTLMKNSFSFPAKASDSNQYYQRDVVIDMPKNWMPVYDATLDDAEAIEQMQFAANGGKKDENGRYTDGPGGVIFLDEFNRIKKDAQDSIMALLADRYFANNTMTLGNKWIIVAVGNRYPDLSPAEKEEAAQFGAAVLTRFGYKRNYVPTFAEWKEWAVKKNEETNEYNIDIDMLNYIELSIEESEHYGYGNQGDFYNVGNQYEESDTADSVKKEMGDVEPTANPRTWFFATMDYRAKKEFNEEHKDDPYWKKHNKAMIMDDTELKVHCVSINCGIPVGERFKKYMTAKEVHFELEDEDIASIFEGTYESNKNLGTARIKTNFKNKKNVFETMIAPKMKYFLRRDENKKEYLDNNNQFTPEAFKNLLNFVEWWCPASESNSHDINQKRLKDYIYLVSILFTPNVVDPKTGNQIPNKYYIVDTMKDFSLTKFLNQQWLFEIEKEIGQDGKGGLLYDGARNAYKYIANNMSTMD